MGRGTARSAVEGPYRVRFAPPPCFAWSPSPSASPTGRTEGLQPQRLLRLAVPERRLGRGQAGDRHAVGRGADIIEADALAEGDRGGVPAMLAADAELEAALHRPAALGGERDQLPHPVLVDRDERVLLKDALLDIVGEEAAGIVAAD